MKIRLKVKWLFPMACAGILLYGIGMEIADAPPRPRVPPGATLLTYGDLAFSDALGLDKLKPGEALRKVPTSVRKLEGKLVVLQGFMIPIQSDDKDGVKAFLLIPNQMSCCFGIPPQINQVVEVRMVAHPIAPAMDQVLTVLGRLHVQEHWEGPYLESLYQMEGVRVDSGPPLPAVPRRNQE
jgi:hypothetical protein